MAVSESKMAEFKMAAIMKLSQNEQVKFFCAKWLKPRWQNSKWLPLSSWVRMNKWTFFVQNCWIQDGRIQYDCHHKVKWEWMSLSQFELVWVRVRIEWECFWVNLREDNKVSHSKMAVSESKMAEFKMATIMKLCQNGQVNFFWCKMAESKMAELKMEEFKDGCHH